MTHWNIQDLAKTCSGHIQGPPDMCVSSFAIDSRLVQYGDMFIALKTPNNDGHKYISQAVEGGASCVLVDHPCTVDIPQIIVSDTYDALTKMGAYARQQFSGTVIGITGSVGKTSVKDTLHAVLSKFGKTQSTKGNLNNHLGVPLTLLSLDKNTEYAVIEMGMSTGGEIRHLSHLSKPHIAVITAIDVAHIENFDDVSGIARAKSEIFEGLVEDKIAIYNASGKHPEILDTLSHQYADIVYAYAQDNIVSMAVSGSVQMASLKLDDVAYNISLPSLGIHRVSNAMAVLLTVKALQLDMMVAIDVMKTHRPSNGRGQNKEYTYNDTKIYIFDETYNSSPASVRAGLQALDTLETKGRKIAILGDMLELGADTAKYHTNIYDETIFNNLDMIFLCGQHMHALYMYVPEKKNIFWSENIDMLCPHVLDVVQHQDILFIKGSRGMKMDRLLDFLQ